MVLNDEKNTFYILLQSASQKDQDTCLGDVHSDLPWNDVCQTVTPQRGGWLVSDRRMID